MSAMTDDRIFEASSGLGMKGTIYDGQRQVRKGLEAVFAQFPDATWSGPEHFTAGDRGVTGRYFQALGMTVFVLRSRARRVHIPGNGATRRGSRLREHLP